MTDIDWKPDDRKLRQFGWISLIGFGVIGAVLGWKLGWFAADQWLYSGTIWGLGIYSAIASLIYPALVRPVYWMMTAISAVIGPIVATLVMGLIFLLVFVPLGLIFKLLGRDELDRELLPDAPTYWADKRAPQPSSRYFRQY